MIFGVIFPKTCWFAPLIEDEEIGMALFLSNFVYFGDVQFFKTLVVYLTHKYLLKGGYSFSKLGRLIFQNSSVKGNISSSN